MDGLLFFGDVIKPKLFDRQAPLTEISDSPMTVGTKRQKVVEQTDVMKGVGMIITSGERRESVRSEAKE